MRKLIVMVGAPGSGKSTVAEKYYNKHNATTKLVSRDKIRFSLVAEDEEYFSKEKEVFRLFTQEIKEGLSLNMDVIADATHLNPKSRAKLFRALGNSLKNTELVAIVIRPPLGTVLSRNEKRQGTRAYVPQRVIYNMYSSFEMPTEEEGFDTIIKIR